MFSLVFVAMVGLGAVGGLSAPLAVADRVAGALWGMLIADALAMPTHWFYGGNRQVQAMLGSNVTSYEKAPHPFPGSIMTLSDTGGGGRGSSEGDIIGTVINHGKKKYWQRGGQYHYHCTLDKGETTLEVCEPGVWRAGVWRAAVWRVGVWGEDWLIVS